MSIQGRASFTSARRWLTGLALLCAGGMVIVPANARIPDQIRQLNQAALGFGPEDEALVGELRLAFQDFNADVSRRRDIFVNLYTDRFILDNFTAACEGAVGPDAASLRKRGDAASCAATAEAVAGAFAELRQQNGGGASPYDLARARLDDGERQINGFIRFVNLSTTGDANAAFLTAASRERVAAEISAMRRQHMDWLAAEENWRVGGFDRAVGMGVRAARQALKSQYAASSVARAAAPRWTALLLQSHDRRPAYEAAMAGNLEALATAEWNRRADYEICAKRLVDAARASVGVDPSQAGLEVFSFLEPWSGGAGVAALPKITETCDAGEEDDGLGYASQRAAAGLTELDFVLSAPSTDAQSLIADLDAGGTGGFERTSAAAKAVLEEARICRREQCLRFECADALTIAADLARERAAIDAFLSSAETAQKAYLDHVLNLYTDGVISAQAFARVYYRLAAETKAADMAQSLRGLALFAEDYHAKAWDNAAISVNGGELVRAEIASIDTNMRALMVASEFLSPAYGSTTDEGSLTPVSRALPASLSAVSVNERDELLQILNSVRSGVVPAQTVGGGKQIVGLLRAQLDQTTRLGGLARNYLNRWDSSRSAARRGAYARGVSGLAAQVDQSPLVEDYVRLMNLVARATVAKLDVEIAEYALEDCLIGKCPTHTVGQDLAYSTPGGAVGALPEWALGLADAESRLSLLARALTKNAVPAAACVR